MNVRRLAALLALVGALAWTLKLVLITANGGSNLDEGAVGVAYLVGAVALFAAGAATGLALTLGRPRWVRVLASLGGLAAVAILFTVLDAIGSALLGDAGPTWLEDEVGIALMALVALVVALLLGRSSRQEAPAD